MSALLALILACARPPAEVAPALPDLAEEAEPEAAPVPVAEQRVEHAGLAGLSCEGGSCRALVEGRLHSVDPLSLALDEGQPLAWGALLRSAPAPTLVGPCPDQDALCGGPLDEILAGRPPAPLPPEQAAPRSPEEIAAAWNQARADEARAGFQARAPAPGGGLMVLVRTGDGARVMRLGGSARFLELTGQVPPAGYARALALHPTGQEAYVLSAPGDSLLAFDPVQLRRRWRIPLRPEAHGLFVDAGGRLLVAEEGGSEGQDRLVDVGTRDAGLPPGAQPDSDLDLALRERPAATSTAVVDLAGPRLVWRESGRYLSLEALPDGAFLLATDQALVRLVLPP